MSKLSIEALKSRAEEIVTGDLLSKISGGTENDCHDDNNGDSELPIGVKTCDRI